tara:strand:- start:848 stop:1030 length:183 start_codon:yes stop_codon:yes gene_type:complete
MQVLSLLKRQTDDNLQNKKKNKGSKNNSFHMQTTLGAKVCIKEGGEILVAPFKFSTFVSV